MGKYEEYWRGRENGEKNCALMSVWLALVLFERYSGAAIVARDVKVG